MRGLRLVFPLLALAAAPLFAPLCAQDHPARVHTTREGAQLLKLPKEDDAFGFVVFGDRTGGVAEGITVLAQAVRDTNLLDPDLVLTVGDLVQGYNGKDEWRRQAEEYKRTMADLRMPWFPVAGNHDIYWRGEGRPAGEHESDFEQFFGPLWYAFSHKQCFFVVLYSDEGDPKTGKKDFGDPDCQKISDEQFAWLQDTLQKSREAKARHVFVFLHHPRWLLRNYPGSDWERVHDVLAKSGNVTAVFAGHIHRMRFDGVRDGIQYYTVASVGAHLSHELPQAGYLHQFHVVTVRPEGIQVAALPVGSVLDPKQITGEVSEDAHLLMTRLEPTTVAGLRFDAAGGVLGSATITFQNPARRPIELTVVPTGDESWTFQPDHQHLRIEPGQTARLSLDARRRSDLGGDWTLPKLELRCDWLGESYRFSLPARGVDLAIAAPENTGTADAKVPGHLRLDGDGDCLELASSALALHDGPLTFEAWLRGEDFSGRRALLAKTQSSEFALFVNDGTVDASVYLGGRYVSAKTAEPVLQPGRWHHVAGVYDGAEVRAYVDGVLVATAKGKGRRKQNALPLYVGADPDGDGTPMSFFSGLVDEVRISTVARYAGETFAPQRRFAPDAETALLLHLDEDTGPWAPDSSPRHTHPRRRGDARAVPADEAEPGRER